MAIRRTRSGRKEQEMEVDMGDQVADQLDQITEEAKRIPELAASWLSHKALGGAPEGELYSLARDVTGALRSLADHLSEVSAR
jgi:hypothetical protein